MSIPPRLAYTCILLVFSPILFSLPPAAQAQVPKGDLFFGYSRTGNDTFYPNVGGLSGWEAIATSK
jgi:hypothetical protein